MPVLPILIPLACLIHMLSPEGLNRCKRAVLVLLAHITPIMNRFLTYEGGPTIVESNYVGWLTIWEKVGHLSRVGLFWRFNRVFI